MSGGPAASGFAGGPGTAGPVAKVEPGTRGGALQSPPVADPSVLTALSEPDLARLVAILEPPQLPQNVALADEWLQAAISATAAGELARALQTVTELAALDPKRAETVVREAGLQAFRPQLESLLSRLAHASTLDAETRVAQAAQAVEAGMMKRLPGWDANPEVLLRIATRLLEAGGHANAVRAAEVAQTVITAAHWGPATAVAAPVFTSDAVTKPRERASAVLPPVLRDTWQRFQKRAPARLLALWRRVPLLMLLLTWLLVGTVGGTAAYVQRRIWPDVWPSWLVDAGYSVWGLGFLVLVLLGFYARIRNVRL